MLRVCVLGDRISRNSSRKGERSRSQSAYQPDADDATIQQSLGHMALAGNASAGEDRLMKWMDVVAAFVHRSSVRRRRWFAEMVTADGSAAVQDGRWKEENKILSIPVISFVVRCSTRADRLARARVSTHSNLLRGEVP